MVDLIVSGVHLILAGVILMGLVLFFKLLGMCVEAIGEFFEDVLKKKR